jgi:hypothetical protein
MGALALIVACGRISQGGVSGSSGRYQPLNLGGILLSLINAAWHHAWPSSVVNPLWIAIALRFPRTPYRAREKRNLLSSQQSRVLGVESPRRKIP